MAKNPRYLVQRSSGYYARLVVPKALRSAVGKNELWAPVGSTSKAEAIRRLPSVVARLQAELNAARPNSQDNVFYLRPPRAEQALGFRQLAVAHYAEELRIDDASRSAIGAALHNDMSALTPGYEAVLKIVASGRFADDLAAATIGWAIDDFVRRSHTKVVPGTPEWRELAKSLAGVQLESLKRVAERDEGDFSGRPTHPLLTKAEPSPGDPLNARILGPESHKTLSELLPSYLTERGAAARSDFDSETTIRMFDEFLDEARPVYRITRTEVNAFKRALSETPSNYTKRFGLTLPEAIKANKKRAVPYPCLNAKTINGKYLSKLHSLLNWCMKNDIVPDNAAAGIKVDSVKDKSQPPRVNFSPSDLSTIFSAERFDKAKGFSEGGWAELVALFSGTRASELAQIKLDSVRTERGVLVLAIEEETKNKGSQRIIPVHSSLIGLGFSDRVKTLREQGHARLFPKWYQNGMKAKARAASNDGKATLNHYFPRFIPKRFISEIRALGIHSPQKTWHSFRHTFKTGLARAGVPRSMQDDLCGHADNSAGAGYVHGSSVEAMKEAVEKLRFDGFGLGS
jgi:integrase